MFYFCMSIKLATIIAQNIDEDSWFKFTSPYISNFTNSIQRR